VLRETVASSLFGSGCVSACRIASFLVKTVETSGLDARNSFRRGRRDEATRDTWDTQTLCHQEIGMTCALVIWKNVCECVAKLGEFEFEILLQKMVWYAALAGKRQTRVCAHHPCANARGESGNGWAP
jgi:hypothetical protein